MTSVDRLGFQVRIKSGGEFLQPPDRFFERSEHSG